MKLKKTKIICTIGPAVRSVDTIAELLKAGMNIARFNFSHGDHAYHGESFAMVREASRRTSIPVALLLDTKGPEIRTGMVRGGKNITLVRGERITLTAEQIEGDEKLLSISYAKLAEEIRPQNHIFVADGLIDLEVERVSEEGIHCLIRNGGEIGSRKNVNVIGVKSSLPAVTEQDVKDIIFGIGNDIDFISASFIRKPDDVREIRSIIDVCDAKVDIIAKIEDQEGLDNIDEIIRLSDGIMVARGDLGVQIPSEEIPLAQKRIIAKCNAANKPVITATQMLDSMIVNPMPTRAEITDVANAIFDGTDAIMLSGETASGKFPVESVRMMHKIALQIENSAEYLDAAKFAGDPASITNMSLSIAHASVLTAKNIGADALLTPTLHGNTPRLISRYRPPQHIIAVTPYEGVRRNLLLYWGVYPVISQLESDSDTMIDNSIQTALSSALISRTSKVVIVAGIPVNSPIMLNTIRIHLVAKVLAKSLRGYGAKASGRIVTAKDASEAALKITASGGEILVTRYLDESFRPLLGKVKGFVLEELSFMHPETVMGINPDLVILGGTHNALQLLSDGQRVVIDGQERLIYADE